jgi:hypothetical protein
LAIDEIQADTKAMEAEVQGYRIGFSDLKEKGRSLEQSKLLQDERLVHLQDMEQTIRSDFGVLREQLGAIKSVSLIACSLPHSHSRKL